MLQRAIYVSDAVGSTGNSALSFAQILGVSDRNNRRDHLTSALLFHQGQFLQVIEGARADVDRLLTRLSADPRHTGLKVLHNGPVETRRFGAWPMGQCRMTPDTDRLLDGRTLCALDAAEAEALLIRSAVPMDLSA